MIPVQAAIGGKIIARETIKGFKDVLTKFMEERALIEKKKLSRQKKGKARSKQFGRVEIQEAFIGVLKISKENSWRGGEWLKAHAWKACKPNRFEGSIPLSRH